MLRLKEIRKQNGFSQQQLAQLLDVTQATLSGWENEKFEIDNKSLLKCSEIFNVSVDYLLGKEEKPSETDDLSNKIIETFNRLDDEKQRIALEYLEFLASRDNQEK